MHRSQDEREFAVKTKLRLKLCLSSLILMVALGCGTTETAEPLVNSGTFEALTYNVAGLPEGISSSSPTDFIPQISPLLNPYDLVLVQEDFVYHRDLSREANHPFQSNPKDPDAKLIADGLNRFSNFEFETLERRQWTMCYGDMTGGSVTGAADCMAEKGFSVARTTLAPGIIVDVYNHHAEAGGGEEDAEARAAGYAQLTEFIQTYSAGNAILIGGDTNLDRFGVWDGPIMTAFESDNAITDACHFLECGTESIDRFFFRNSDSVKLTPTSWRFADEFITEEGDHLSDHYAVHVGFQWERVN